MTTNTLNNASALPAASKSIIPATTPPGIGSTIVIASCTAFLMVTSSVAVWSQVEPVVLLVARVTG